MKVGILANMGPVHLDMHKQAWSNGVTLVPLPMRDTPEQRRRFVEAVGVHHIVCDEHHVDEAASLPTNPRPGPGGTFAVVRTSGSTGEPSIVHIQRNQVTAHRNAAIERLGCTQESMWWAALPPWHVGGLGLIDRTLHGGGGLRMADRNIMPGGITHASLVPTMLARTHEIPDSMECLLIGGDRLPTALAEDRLGRDWPIFASYGLTEAFGQVATATPGELRENPGTSGRPLRGVQIDIVDGQIVVSGPTVVGRLETGDLGRIDDGLLYVEGRSDDRIVTGGENIDPARVEEILAQAPGVERAAVVGVPDDDWGSRVVAMILPEESVSISADDVDAWAKKHLAAHERPKEIRFTGDLPQTNNGKIQRAAIRRDW